VTELGCWAHARRKFFDVHAANGSSIAQDALQRIGKIYEIESAAREQGFTAEARHALRQDQGMPSRWSLA